MALLGWNKSCDPDEMKFRGKEKEKETEKKGDHPELVGLGDELIVDGRGGRSGNDDPGGIQHVEEGKEEIRDRTGAYEKEKEAPPIDDVCPICFDIFTIPCRSNCGHWFCASCIMHFWTFQSSIQPCKCPMCYSRIINLNPGTCQPIPPAANDDDHVDALKKVHHYNGLYSSGSLALSTFHRTRALFPVFMKRVFEVLTNPGFLRCSYYMLRLLGLFLALLYERWECEFVPTGGLGIRRMFDMGATILVVTLFLVGTGYPWVLGRCRAGAGAGARGL